MYPTDEKRKSVINDVYLNINKKIWEINKKKMKDEG